MKIARNRLFRIIVLSGCALALIYTGLVGCGSSPAGTANVRFYQASPDAPALTITLDGNPIASNFLYQDDTGYLSFEEGAHEIRVRDGASNDTILILDPTFTAGQDYTIILVNPFASIEALNLTDNNTAPPAGDFKFRFLNMAPSSGAVDVYIFPPDFSVDTSVALTSNVAYQGGTDYANLVAGSYIVALTPTGQKTILKSSAALSFGAGDIQTVLLLDSAGGGAPFLLQILSDAN